MVLEEEEADHCSPLLKDIGKQRHVVMALLYLALLKPRVVGMDDDEVIGAGKED